MHPLLKDPWVAAQIDAGLAKHRGALTKRQIEAFREKMAWTFANHPVAQRILARARAAATESSSERVKDGVDVPAADDADKEQAG